MSNVKTQNEKKSMLIYHVILWNELYVDVGNILITFSHIIIKKSFKFLCQIIDDQEMVECIAIV